MSDRRPPRADPPPAAAADPDPPAERQQEAALPGDAGSLGYADLAELPPGAELPAFRELRARLFADIDPAADDADFGPPERSAAPARPALFVPAQFSIANGARTAAEIADADVDVDQGVEWQVSALIGAAPLDGDPVDAEPVDAEPVDAEQVTAASVDAEPIDTQVGDEANADSGPADVAMLPLAITDQAVDLDEDIIAPPAVDPSPTGAPAATLGTAVRQPTLPAPTSTIETEPASRRILVFVLLAAFVVVSLIGGWILLTRNDDQGASSVDAVAGVTTRVQSVAVATIDGGSVRATQRLEFDDPVSTLRLRVPQRGSQSAIADFKPTVGSIEISVAGQPVQRVADELASGVAIIIDLDHPSDSISLSYVAEDAVVRTEPSSANRAKAWMTPLRVGAADGSARLLTVQGGDVLNLGCAVRRATVACGEQTGEGWTVAPGPTTNVIAQVDLPD